ncbi:MAG: M28 family peptidase [Gemmatimonadota bacterium]|nr:MAG: M28 family peptidase [Gemmatimonadota bacterium]
MEYSRFVSLAIAVAAVACSSGPSAEAPAPEAGAEAAEGVTAAAITTDDLEMHLTAFAHDSMMGRESGTLGNYLATEYLAAEAARIGLEPAGDDGTYFQTLPVVQRRVDPEASPSVAGEPLELGKDYVPLPRMRGLLPFGMKGSLDGVQVIFAGKASDAGAALTAEQMAGKLVVFDTPVGPDGSPNMEAWNRQSLQSYASAAGVAVAVLELLPPRFAAFFTRPRETLGGGALPEGPLGMFVSREAAARLVGTPLDGLAAGTLGETIEGTFRFVQAPVPHQARNVVGILRGSDPSLRDQYVAIGSHTDHVGTTSQPLDHDSVWAFNHIVRPMGAESPRREPTAEEEATIRQLRASFETIRRSRLDSVFNGADDDGSGSVAMLEIAEALVNAEERPRRSILFVWHTGEEKGLWGASWFTDNPTVPRDSIVAQLNLDMVGRGSDDDIEGGGPGYLQLIGSRRLSTELGDLVEEVNTTGGHGFEFDYQYDAEGHPQNYYCRSDHYMYARYGIPIVFFSTGSHQDYHQLTDESQYIDYEKLRDVSRLLYGIAETIANLDHRIVVDKPKPDPNAPCRQ